MMDRKKTLAAIARHVTDADIVLPVYSTAFDWIDIRPNPLNYLSHGAMGLASSHALGLALGRPDRRVIVLDGDGALLMRLGACAIIGHEAPANLVHVLLDNGVHDSTGAQATVAPAVDLAGVAHACGYRDVRRVASAGALLEAVRGAREGPVFLHVRTHPRTDRKLPRPSETPAEIAARFAAWMNAHPA